MKQLTVVGLGPGGPQGLTAQAQEALGEADLICGYTCLLYTSRCV